MNWLQGAGAEGPGPGYYDVPTSFDRTLGDSDRPSLNAVAEKKRQMSVFESRTVREFPLTRLEMDAKAGPGPTDYVLPELFKPATKPPSQQCFDSRVDRFTDVSISPSTFLYCCLPTTDPTVASLYISYRTPSPNSFSLIFSSNPLPPE